MRSLHEVEYWVYNAVVQDFSWSMKEDTGTQDSYWKYSYSNFWVSISAALNCG